MLRIAHRDGAEIDAPRLGLGGGDDITERLANVSQDDKKAPRNARELAATMEQRELERMIKEMENQMRVAAKELEFERAAMLRDQVYELKAILVEDSNLPPWKKQALLARDLGD